MPLKKPLFGVKNRSRFGLDLGLCFNRFLDTVLAPFRLPFGTRGAHFAHLLRVHFLIIFWNRFLMVLAPNMVPKVPAECSLFWGPKKHGVPEALQCIQGHLLDYLWPSFGLLFGFLGSPFASPFAPLTSLWSPLGLGLGT